MRLARDGGVLAVGRQDAALAAVCDAIRSAGGTAERIACDVTDADAPRAIVRRAIETFGGIDVLVNAAGHHRVGRRRRRRPTRAGTR